MKTFIIKNTWLTFTNHGWGNGYVLIPTDSPLHGMHYNDIDVDIHGGITFSELIDENLANQWGISPDNIGLWAVGFDTAHFMDTEDKWPKEAVQAETDLLAERLKEYEQTL